MARIQPPATPDKLKVYVYTFLYTLFNTGSILDTGWRHTGSKSPQPLINCGLSLAPFWLHFGSKYAESLVNWGFVRIRFFANFLNFLDSYPTRWLHIGSKYLESLANCGFLLAPLWIQIR